jgi:anaphase-promoting complex subunit 11
MKVKINSWNAVATWKWDIETEECCTICQFAFESPCPRCKVPGDDCVPIQGQCLHHFHLHCILKWTEEGSSEDCPLCRKKWVAKN